MPLIVLLLAVAVALLFHYPGRSKLKVGPSPPRLIGNGSYTVAVVGESNYLASFEKICGRRTADCINRKTEANLILESDNKFDRQAVRLSIEGYTVGYLFQTAAREFRYAVVSVGLGRSTVFECAAHIRGGWDRGRGKQGNYGVRLDMPGDGRLGCT